MKRKSILFYVASLLLFAVIVNQSCNGDANGANLSTRPPAKRTFIDTTKLLAVFVTPDRKNILQDIVFRVRFDSVQLQIKTGENTFKQMWGVDSAYFIPRIDTVKDAMQRPVFDSATGRPKLRTIYDGTYKDLVWESNIRVDSAIKRFQKFLIVDSTAAQKAAADSAVKKTVQVLDTLAKK